MTGMGNRGPVGRDWFGLAAFDPGPWFHRDGGRLYLLKEVGSTNDFLLGRGDPARGRVCDWDGWGWRAGAQTDLEPLTGPDAGTVVVARRQTAGRGRQGRPWVDCGGLHMSVVVPPHRASFDRGFSVWLGLLVVLSLRDDFNMDVRLKWPNDLMAGNRKLGGILLESTGAAERTIIVAGLGLNIGTRSGDFPPQLQGVATSILRETGREVRPAEVAAKVLSRVESELQRFDAEGWPAYRSALACLDCLLGRDICVQQGGGIYRGRAVGIDDSGGLILQNADGDTVTFSGGQVHILEHGLAPAGE